MSAKTRQNATKKRTDAAILLAEDDLTDEQIADRIGVHRATLARWKTEPEFAALVGDYHGQIIAQALKLPIAKKHHRIKVLNDLHTKALSVIDERTVIDGNAAPGESTGLVVRQYKQIGAGKDAQFVEEYAVDTGLMREIRDLHKQAAQELGQWVEQSKVTQQTTMVQIIGDEDDE